MFGVDKWYRRLFSPFSRWLSRHRPNRSGRIVIIRRETDGCRFLVRIRADEFSSLSARLLRLNRPHHPRWRPLAPANPFCDTQRPIRRNNRRNSNPDGGNKLSAVLCAAAKYFCENIFWPAQEKNGRIIDCRHFFFLLQRRSSASNPIMTIDWLWKSEPKTLYPVIRGEFSKGIWKWRQKWSNDIPLKGLICIFSHLNYVNDPSMQIE